MTVTLSGGSGTCHAPSCLPALLIQLRMCLCIPNEKLKKLKKKMKENNIKKEFTSVGA